MLAFYSLFLSAKLQKINDICKKINNYFSIICKIFSHVKYEGVFKFLFCCFKENLYLCLPVWKYYPIVTPGISRGELLMKNECIEQGYPLIHLQKEPIGQYWKPEKKRLEACVNGSLLILAPWDLDTMGNVGNVPSDCDYSRFHNLNTLAAEISTFNGEAKIIR